METLGVIVKETEPTDWVSSLVTVEKPDKTLRVCLDPKDLNKAIKRSHHPLPTVDETLDKLAGAKIFSKLDASSAYWQIPVDEQSSKLLTFNTPFGRYRFLRLPYGIHSASELFQKEVEDIIRGIETAANVQDDIVVWGRNQEEHDRSLKEVLKRIAASGMKLNKNKCEFSKTEIIFLGHKVTSEGILPDPAKTEAVRNMKAPKTKLELQRFLGMMNFLGKFIKDLAEITGPLRELLQKDREFHMSDVHRASFEKLKELATSAPILKNFCQGKEIMVTADSSDYGLGAAIFQKHEDNWHPVAYASRSLTKTEQAYAQIEKENLSVVFATTRFHQYVYANKFLVVNDHSSLQTIFGKQLSKMPARIQRMMLKIQAYPDMTLEYRPGSKLVVADTLSRAPEDNEDSPEIQDLDLQVHRIIDSLPFIPERLTEIKEETKKDVKLNILKDYIQRGWPKTTKECNQLVAGYWGIREDLTVMNDIIFRNEQVVVPASMRPLIKEKIHRGHLGITKCRERARSNFYWPNINADIERMIKSCGPCQENRNMQSYEENIAVEAEYPWQIVGSDFFHYQGCHFLIVTDYFSGFPEVEFIGKNSEYPTAKSLINKFSLILARYGIPEKVISDGGPEYTSKEFKDFAKKWEFVHQTSSPEYAKGNARAERSVQTVKQLLKKSGEDFWTALLEYRATPIAGSKLSPAEMMFDRNIRTQLTSHKQPQRVPEERRQQEQRKYTVPKKDQNNKHLSPLSPGDTVRMWNKKKKKWLPKARVLECLTSPRSYLIETEAGRQYKRNRQHLLKTEEEFIPDTHVFNNIEDTLQAMQERTPARNEPARQPVREEIPQREEPIQEPMLNPEERIQRAGSESSRSEPVTSETDQPPLEDDTSSLEEDESTEREVHLKPNIFTTYLSEQYLPSSPSTASTSSADQSSLEELPDTSHDNALIRRGNPPRSTSDIPRLGVGDEYIEADKEWTASEDEASIYNIIIGSFD